MTPHKILIADDSKHTRQKILASEKAKAYKIETADSGPECLEKIKSFDPDLILIKLMLPKLHGLEVLTTLREAGSSICVIVTTEKSMIQDYKSAIEAKANYYLIKPFEPDTFFQLVERYFKEGLDPDPYEPKFVDQLHEHCYSPDLPLQNYMKFWGTRGSVSVSGSNYARFGGDTSCFELFCNQDLIIFDAGTGIRPLGEDIIKRGIKTIHLFLSHTHWDHVIGFPFFQPLYHADYEIHLYAPKTSGRPLKELMTYLLAYEFFPVRMDEVAAELHFHEIHDSDSIKFSNLELSFHYTFHPGMSICFKAKTKNHSIVYVTDNELLMGNHRSITEMDKSDPLVEPHLDFIDFVADCTLLIHEAQYTQKEYVDKVGWGHSSIANAAILLKFCKPKKWIVTHHDPSHSDEALLQKEILHEQILKDCKLSCPISYAYDGKTLPIF